MRRYAFAALLLSTLYLTAYGQKIAAPAATRGTDRLKSYQQRQQLEARSLVKNVPFRSIGPSLMSGRVVDMEVSPADPTHFYVAYAVSIRIKTAQGLVLRSFSRAGNRGLNYAAYDLSLDLAALDAYRRHLNESRPPGEKEVLFTPTDTGRQYLCPGKHLVELETGRGQTFTVQSLENRGR